MSQSSEETEDVQYVETLLRRAIIAIGPNRLHDHGHIEKFLCETHLGIEISSKEMNYLFDLWQKGGLQEHLINYIPDGFHQSFQLNGNLELCTTLMFSLYDDLYDINVTFFCRGPSKESQYECCSNCGHIAIHGHSCRYWIWLYCGYRGTPAAWCYS